MNERWVTARVNRMVYFISIFIGLALGGGYFFDYINSEVPAPFFFAFIGIVIVQQICSAVVYFRDKGSPKFKYVALIGYAAVYFIAMFGRIDALLGLNEDSISLYIYVLIIPVMIMYIGYYDMKLIKIMATGTIIFNIAKVVFHIYIGYTSEDNVSEYLVQMGCIIITVVSVYAVAKITYENHLRKLKETEIAARQAEEANEANRNKQVTINTLESILDGINTSIYLTVPKTGELLFINKWLKEFMGRGNDNLTGEYCYKVFRGFDEICDFCPCHRLNENPEQTIVWEECFEPYGVYVRHTHSYIDWPNGEKAHLQYGIDVTEIRKKQEAERAAHQAELARGKAEAAANAMRDSITYASKIQRNLLPSDADMAGVFSDTSVVWKPRDIVGGDIYWMKQFDKGTVLCVADCTGHGTPGALLTMLVVSALESIVWPSNCDDTAGIVWQLDQRLSDVLHVKSGEGNSGSIIDIKDGCDIAVLYVTKDGAVRFSSGKIPVFICDGNEVVQHKGQKIFVGEGKINNKDEVNVIDIPVNPNNKFYIASDGLFEQPGGKAGRQFGFKTFKKIINDNHNEKPSVITDKIWKAFEEYCGDESQCDDFELVAFRPYV